MRKVTFFLILVLAFLPAACYAGIVIPYLSSAIVIDAQDNDPGWIGQPVYDYGEPYLFLDYRIDPATEECKLMPRFGRDAQNLYFYLCVKDREVVTKPWTNWRGADLGMICYANGTTEKVALVMPTVGMRILTPGSEDLDTTTGTLATRTTADGYVMEGSIPLLDIGGVPANGKIKFAVVQRNWNEGQFDYTAVSSVPTAVYVTEGQKMWEDAEVKVSPTIPVVSAEAIKNFPENVTFRADQLQWHVTYADADRFIGEDQKRIKAIEVLWSNVNRPAVNDIVLSVTGKKVAGKLQADAVSFLPGYGKAFPTKPWGMNSTAICPLNANLSVKLAGTVKQLLDNGFLISDGGRDIRVLWPSCLTVGQFVFVTGPASNDQSGTILLATDVAGY